MKGFALEGYDWNVRRHKQNSPGITLRRRLIPYNEEATAESLGQFFGFFLSNFISELIASSGVG